MIKRAASGSGRGRACRSSQAASTLSICRLPTCPQQSEGSLQSRSPCAQSWGSSSPLAPQHGDAPQAHDGLMQYGAFGGMSPYAMVADGASVRATSVPAFDLTAANPQYHPVGAASQRGPLLIRASPADLDRHVAEHIRVRQDDELHRRLGTPCVLWAAQTLHGKLPTGVHASRNDWLTAPSHPCAQPVITGGESYQRQARGPSPHGGQQPVPSNVAQVAGEAPQVCGVGSGTGMRQAVVSGLGSGSGPMHPSVGCRATICHCHILSGRREQRRLILVAVECPA